VESATHCHGRQCLFCVAFVVLFGGARMPAWMQQETPCRAVVVVVVCLCLRICVCVMDVCRCGCVGRGSVGARGCVCV
jgi:hypothetical protein